MDKHNVSISSPRTPDHYRLAFAAMLISNICLAFGPWFVRLSDVGPLSSAFWRMALAVPMLVILTYYVERRQRQGTTPNRLTPALWLILGLAGILFAADLASWHFGIHHTKLANATLFGNSASLIYPLYGFLIARAWPSKTQSLALIIAAIGASLLMGRSYELSPANLIGDIFCLLAGVFYSFYFMLMSKARDSLRPLPSLCLMTIAGVLPLLLFALAMGENIWPQSWTVLILLALFSQVIGQGLMIYALGHLSPLVIGLGLLVQPIFAATIGWFAYGERMGALDVIGAIAIAIALILIRRPASPAA